MSGSEVPTPQQAALNLLTPPVYNELRRLAERYVRSERSTATLEPTALVQEACLRLLGQNIPDYENRGHFLAVAAHWMRQMVVDHARRHGSAQRGSGAEKLSIDELE